MLAILLDAAVVVAGAGGEREIPASEFFLGFFTTSLEPGELVVEVRFPRPRPHAALQEFARRHGDFAIVAAAVAVDVDHDRISDARVVVGGVDEVPLRVEDAERALEGAAPGGEAFAEAGRAAAAAVEPSGDVHGSAEYRKELTDVLVRRALAEAIHADRRESNGRG
jgi:aerobic carbon-monoxide dehydrogenase medium subunit